MKPDAAPSERPVRAGVFSGAVAAIVGSLAQLPLHAPSDTLFNSGTVMAAALAIGLAGGVLWKVLRRHHNRLLVFAAAWLAAFLGAVLVAFLSETQLDRSISFIAPLAAVVLGITGAGTVALARAAAMRRWALVAAALAVAVGVGVGLVGQGDAESGRLELPPRQVDAGIERGMT